MSMIKVRRKVSTVIKQRTKKKKGGRDFEFLQPNETYVLFKAIEAGMPPRKAADLAGISSRKYDEWMQRGRKKDPKYSSRCYRFRTKVIKLERQREIEALNAIRNMGNGGLEVTETRIKMIGEKETEIIRTTKNLAPQWQAAAWFLERRCDDYKSEVIDTRTPEERAREINALVLAMKATVPPQKED